MVGSKLFRGLTDLVRDETAVPAVGGGDVVAVAVAAAVGGGDGGARHEAPPNIFRTRTTVVPYRKSTQHKNNTGALSVACRDPSRLLSSPSARRLTD